MAGVDQFDFQSSLDQDFVDRNPINAGGLHGHGLYPAGLQPIGQGMQIRGESQEGSDVRFGPVLRHTSPDFGGAHVQTSGIQANTIEEVQFCWLGLLFFHGTAP